MDFRSFDYFDSAQYKSAQDRLCGNDRVIDEKEMLNDRLEIENFGFAADRIGHRS